MLLTGKVGRSSKPRLPAGLLTHSCTIVVRSKLTVPPDVALTLAVARRVPSRSLDPLALAVVHASPMVACFQVA